MKKYLFISKDKSGNIQNITTKWDFQSIVRKINGSSEVTLSTNKTLSNFLDTETGISNQITIRVATDNTGSEGLDYFSGYVAQRSLNIEGSEERITVRCFGHISKLYQAVWRDGTTTTHNYTAGSTASQISKDVVDDYRTLDSTFPVNYTSTSVENTGTIVKDKFELTTFGTALDKVIDLAQTTNRIWFWRILGDNVFTLRRNNVSPDHLFTLKKDIASLTLEQDIINAANEAFIYFANTTINRYSDASKIDTYGYISDIRRETNVPDAATASEIGNAILNNFAPAILKINLTVTGEYHSGIENIKPGDTCKILNVPSAITTLLTDNMLITKTTYKKDTIDLELSIKHPRIDSALENIRRRFEKSRVEGVPTIFSDS